MTDTETITVADVSGGAGGDGSDPGQHVDLPVVELLTGRGFITGKSGSGKSNTASVVVEKLLSKNFPVLVVDTDGEYYGLKEEFELLHAGADEECDIQVGPEHAGKLAALALEQNVPIILDVSGYLDEDEGKHLLLETVRSLFAKEKKLKKPFLLLIEECHEYIPEGGGLDETGKMLIKVGKRGRKHGLGIVGISQRPADVKKDFITQCDWLVWHRLTWNNDTSVVRRIIDAEHADAVEDLDDGEAFLMTDWSEAVRRVQFHRKSTFDAGATPGLEDFERPDLKSVSGDLVAELRDISDQKERRESELAELRQEIERKDARIRDLERELEEARDLRRMADQFAQAMLQKAEAPHRGGEGQNRSRPESQSELYDDERDGAGEGATDDARAGADGRADAGAEDGVETGAVSERARTNGTADAGGEAVDGAAGNESESESESGGGGDDPGAGSVPSRETLALEIGTRDALIAQLRDRIDRLDDVSRGMLREYRAAGPATPVDAHVAGGGSADREIAYGRNRRLRRAGLVEHAGRECYDYALPSLVREAYDDRLDRQALATVVTAVEESFVDVETERAEVASRWPVPETESADAEVVEGDATGRQDAAFRDDDAAVIEDGEGPPESADDAVAQQLRSRRGSLSRDERRDGAELVD